MSLSLYSPQVELWQTPTWVTNIALRDHKGEARPLEETLYIYGEWVRKHRNGVYHSTEALEDMKERIESHLEELKLVKEVGFV